MRRKRNARPPAPHASVVSRAGILTAPLGGCIPSPESVSCLGSGSRIAPCPQVGYRLGAVPNAIAGHGTEGRLYHVVRRRLSAMGRSRLEPGLVISRGEPEGADHASAPKADFQEPQRSHARGLRALLSRGCERRLTVAGDARVGRGSEASRRCQDAPATPWGTSGRVIVGRSSSGAGA